jgi:hypothetical protein
MPRYEVLLIALATVVTACDGSGEDGSASSAGGGDSSSGGGNLGPPNEKLGLLCNFEPEGFCGPELECDVSCTHVCEGPGPGNAHGCPGNGFCHVVDQLQGPGYCERLCETNEDCAGTGADCRPFSSTEAWNLKICVAE